MKVPLSWLKQFVPLNQTADEIALHLTRLGIEVEQILGKTASFSHVITAKVVSTEKHPHADRLQVATVTDGIKTYQVVCGAANCQAGIITAFAQIGASLTDPEGKTWQIKQSKIRQVESFGMLCAKDELGLEKHSSGIIEFDLTTPLGIPVEQVVLDPIFDLSLTPNLGHVQHVLGVARELAASFNLPLTLSSLKPIVKGNQTFQVHIENPEDTPRFTCRIIEGVSIAPSPSWLQHRLTACGMTPINNVIDALHYTMLERGIPLHAYDRACIQGNELFVKRIKEPISFLCLDQTVRQVPQGALMVHDHHHPVALAGIIGEKSCCVTENTHTLLLEAAAFSPLALRKISRQMELKTDAFSRFDKGVDISSVLDALEQASLLITQIAGGICHPVVDTFPLQLSPRIISCRLERVNQILGFNFSLDEVISLLARLDLHVEDEKSAPLLVKIPSYRNDLIAEIDLIEEIARLYGYHNFSTKNPIYSTGSLPDSFMVTLENQMRSLLIQEGLQECITCDLISPGEQEMFETQLMKNITSLHVLHPRSLDQSVLRTSLLPGLLNVAEHNFNHQMQSLALFEIGRVHFKEKNTLQEPSCVAILLSGPKSLPHFRVASEPFDFFDLKGLISNVLEALFIPSFSFKPSHIPSLHPFRQAEIVVHDEVIGTFGQLHPTTLLQAGLKESCLFAELSLTAIFHLQKKPPHYQPITPYPSSVRDWTVKVKKTISYSEIVKAIELEPTPYLESFTLLSSFEAPHSCDEVHITLRFVYRNREETIAASVVDQEHDKLTHCVAKKLADLL
ncbi:MAG: phenylalanine--tRNA ligase subunit beta [Candidatus Rhabdochlamydia sp.]